MNDYLAKPLDEVALKNILLKYLSAFLKSPDVVTEINSNDFLLQLAGGDEQMAAIILQQVKQEIPVEITKLKKIISEKNVAALPAACHYLISSISPLGNNSKAMQMVIALQKKISNKETENIIFKSTATLINELENTFNNLKEHQN